MNEINLIQVKNGKLRQKQVLSFFRLTSMLLLFLVAISAISIFFIRITSPLSKAKAQQIEALRNVESSKSRLSKQVLTENRLQALIPLLETRSTYDTSFRDVLEAIPKDVSIQTIVVKNTKLSLTAYTGNLTSVDDVFAHLADLTKNQKIFKNVTLTSFSINQSKKQFFFTIDGELL